MKRGSLAATLGAERRDYYSEFIEGSRWLRREQAAARTTWFDDLETKDKRRALFEFEMYLKGLVCFGNPMNHPGPPRRGEPAVTRDFRDELGILRIVIRRVIESGRNLSEGKERAVVFQRYLESVIVRDEARFEMTKRSLSQDTPEQSLVLLVSSFQNLIEVIDGLLRAEHVSFKLFTSVVRIAAGEIHRSTYFNPLAALEFRVEFDRIRPNELLDMVRGIDSDPARKVAALTFLALFRLLGYLEMIESTTKDDSLISGLFAWLAVLRSDARALTIFLKRDVGSWISGGFGRQFEQLRPESVKTHFDELGSEFKALKSLRELLGSIGDQLKLEQRRVFEQHLPAIETMETLEEYATTASTGMAPLRAFIQNAIVLLALEFDPSLSGSKMFIDLVPEVMHSERLRRDIWMFQQILRAFIEKAKSSTLAADKWSGKNTFHFVKEFVAYFRSMGYQLLRYSDYEKFDKFIHLVDRLREGDVLEVQRLEHVVTACEDFQAFLKNTFDSVSKRSELENIPFDRKEAIRTLRLFLKR